MITLFYLFCMKVNLIELANVYKNKVLKKINCGVYII
jgi:hypothetical protein